MTENIRTCRHCGGTFALPDGAGVCTMSSKDPVTKRPTGHVTIMVNGVRVHECWHEPQTDKS